MDKGSKTGARGRRCVICTGCGLCPGVVTAGGINGLQILTSSGGGSISLKNESGRRLACADIGTTTIAMELYREDGSVEERYVTVNPQIKYGRDVLSRITAAKVSQQKKEMQDMVKSALTQGAERFLKYLKTDESLVMTISANTTMSYLLMGWETEELGQAPFHAGRLLGARFFLKAGEVDREVSCLLLPGISAFVGGDIYAGIMACEMTRTDELTLLIDLGTNGEMALGNRSGILATATAAGPAFEGGAGRGIFGADLVHDTALLLQEGLLDETGLLSEPYFERGIRIGNVLMTQEAVRSLQMAKAAIYAGVLILSEQYGVPLQEIQKVVLAGGFGYFLRPEDAVLIGMLPAQLQGRTVSGGNTALIGAKKIGGELLERKFWDGEDLLSAEGDIHTINLAEEPGFAGKYVKAMELKRMEQ